MVPLYFTQQNSLTIVSGLIFSMDLVLNNYFTFQSKTFAKQNFSTLRVGLRPSEQPWLSVCLCLAGTATLITEYFAATVVVAFG